MTASVRTQLTCGITERHERVAEVLEARKGLPQAIGALNPTGIGSHSKIGWLRRNCCRHRLAVETASCPCGRTKRQ